jgi:glycosyltransferase involved in cell wall biosynthesis
MFYPKIIHLNSLVLIDVIPYLRKNYKGPIISHVRELLKHKISGKDRQAILQLDAVITIDSAVTKRFIEVVPEYPVEKIHQILNPFCARPFDDSLSRLFPDEGKFVFAIIGTVSRDKGVDLVCECFYEADLKDSVLIVFGSTDSEYASSIKMKWLNRTDKIVWAGEHEYLAKRGAYSRIDVVVRADPSFRTGRTVYEGLYAVSDLVIQGDVNDLMADPSLSTGHDNITLYTPRDRTSLVNALRTAFKKVEDLKAASLERKLLSNYNDYRENMDLVYSQLLKSHDLGKS